MAKAKDTSTETTTAPKQSADEASAKGDVAERVAAENAQGFVGQKVDPVPNEEYSLESGPDSPTTTGNRTERVTTEDLNERE